MTPLELQAKRDEIVKSIGIVRATYGDKSLEYAKQSESLSLIDREINSVSATPRTRQIRMYSDKGF